MSTTKIILLCLAVCWSMAGAMYYVFLTSYVKIRLQRFVLLLISGPVVWLFALSWKGIEWVDALIVGPLEKFERWLTKN